jgi:general secretion pathway protein G
MTITRSQSAGFTLVELLVAATILSILTAVVAISFRQANMSARDAKRKSDMQELRGSIENYRLETGLYPASVNQSGGYEVSSGGTFMQNLPSQFKQRNYTDPLINSAVYYYRYRYWNLPGCTYELSAKMESGNAGQSCAACGINDPTLYCLSDQ